MRLHRFYIPEPVGSRTELIIRSSALVNQLRRVLRLKTGEEVVIFDGSGSDYTVAIAHFDGADGVVFDVRGSARSRYMPARKICLCAAVVKKDSFELIVEKATELGVTDIVPVIAERSEKKSLNEERLAKIAVEASEQSGRGDAPTIHPVISLKKAVGLFAGDSGAQDSKTTDVSGSEGFASGKQRFSQVKRLKANYLVAFHTDGIAFDVKDLPKEGPIVVFIGPEGGWSPEEIAMFHKNEIQSVCLGSQVLRAETAVIAALSQVMFGQ